MKEIYNFLWRRKKRKFGYDKLISNDDLVEIIGVSKRTLQRYRHSGLIEYVVIYGRYYYDLRDVERALKEHTLRCNPEKIEELNKLFASKIIDYGAIR